jgi:hypothetical protein
MFSNISKNINLGGFIGKGATVDTKLDLSTVKKMHLSKDELEKSELTESLRYDNNFKYNKSGKEIKAALSKARSQYQLEKDTIANQLTLAKADLTVSPFAPVSSWNYRGFEKKIGLMLRFPWEWTRYAANEQGIIDNGYGKSMDDCCLTWKQQYNIDLKSDQFPNTKEDCAKYEAYNELVDKYINVCADICQLDIMIKNLADDKKIELSQQQMLQLDQYMDDTVEKGDENDLEKGKGEGSKGGKVIGHTTSGKPVYAKKRGEDYKNFTSQDHEDAAQLHYEISDHGHHFQMKESHAEEYQRMVDEAEEEQKNRLNKKK